MTPRPGAVRSAWATCSLSRGRHTRAPVGAVRPQPDSNSAGIDPEREQKEPDGPDDLERTVAEHHVLRRAPLATVNEQRVTKDGAHEGDDRHLDPDGGAA